MGCRHDVMPPVAMLDVDRASGSQQLDGVAEQAMAADHERRSTSV
jgi:hypothetical protein